MHYNKITRTLLLILLFGVINTFSQGLYSGVGLSSNINQIPTTDGVISPGEYSSSLTFGSGDYLLYWEVTGGTTIHFGIIGKTTGWVAIGFDPDSRMLNADVIFAWVESNGTVVFYDAFSRDQAGPDHPSDTDIGGSFDLLSFNATENTTTTTIEFSRLLSTGDSGFDKVIPTVGSLNIIWALGTMDSFSQYHGGSRGTATVTFVSTGDTSTTSMATSTSTSDTTTTNATSSGFEPITLLIGLITAIWFLRQKR